VVFKEEGGREEGREGGAGCTCKCVQAAFTLGIVNACESGWMDRWIKASDLFISNTQGEEGKST
jgi:hypothetical protein